MKEPQLVLDANATLGEGPSWDQTNQVLYWVDVQEKRVHVYDPYKHENRSIQLNQFVGAVVPREAGGVALALASGFYTLDLRTEALCFIGDPERHLTNNRFNDGKCDPKGRFWAGTMSLMGEAEQGTLYRLNTNESIQPVLTNVSVSNGICWSPDHQTMYYIDTPTQSVTAFDYELETGNISKSRVVIKVPDREGKPDGMTIDEEGMLWIAHWGGYQVARWNPYTGKKLDRILLPASLCTSCVFGGKNLDELFITTARFGISEDELSKQPHAGGLFRVKTNVKGAPTYAFKG
ncbi:SMP-30/gluconolactonase/LRE family protein [Novibacillus thermophilus]|uniref:Regucalcin n=1 Tax=Novibacillus thermophilus TaxID=1471761 RepID=A0A1U9KA66_9BACL|nr:SMP-30/gluconolactonase/LRE family protein [Novibacillus thermophilus]AQS56957.1 SMP-30/gluconolaconase/LRE domain protein [Novibacillus thermophilus]